MSNELTPREWEAIRTYLRCKNGWEAAIAMNIQPQTYKNLRQGIYRKTGSQNMAQVVWKLRRQLENGAATS